MGFVDWFLGIFKIKQKTVRYKQGEFYEYSVETILDDKQILPIKIIQGKYAGTIFAFDTIRIVDEDDDGAVATYNINVIQYGSKLRKDFGNDEKFLKIVGDILLSVMYDAIEFEKQKELLDDEHREDYFEEPLQQRTVRKKDSAIH